MNREELLVLYKTLFKTWRSQVDSYWQRAAYFAAFETAALAGCWHVVRKEVWAGSLLSILGSILTLVWLYNNHKVHNYVVYWWKSLQIIEARLHMADEAIDFVTQQKGGGLIPYRYLVQIVPAIFLFAWFTMFVWSVLLWCRCS